MEKSSMPETEEDSFKEEKKAENHGRCDNHCCDWHHFPWIVVA